MAKRNNAKTSAKAENTVLSADLKALIAQTVAEAIAAIAPVSNAKAPKSNKVNETIKDCPLKVGDLVKTPLDCVRTVTAIVSATQVKVARNGKNDKIYNVKSLTKITKKQASSLDGDTRTGRLNEKDYLKAIFYATYGADEGKKKLNAVKDTEKALEKVRKFRKENKMGKFGVLEARETLSAMA